MFTTGPTGRCCSSSYSILDSMHVLIAIQAFHDFFDFMTHEVTEMCEQLNGLYMEVEGVYQ